MVAVKRCAFRPSSAFRGARWLIERQGDAVVLRPKPEGWDDFFARASQVPDDFLVEREGPAARGTRALLMRYMLDTNICSYVLRSRPASVKERFDEAGPDALGISDDRPRGTAVRRRAARQPARPSTGRSGTSSPGWNVLPWDEAAAEHYGDLRAGLERRGRPLGAMDLMIAAHARSRGATLVSNDVCHFERVEGPARGELGLTRPARAGPRPVHPAGRG